MKFALTLVCAVLIPCAAIAQESGTLAEPTFEVVRLGDSSLDCETLVAEINDLNGQMAAIQQRMMSAGEELGREAMQSTRRSAGGGLAMGLGGMAAGLIPGGSLVVGAVQAAGQHAAEASMRSRQESLQQRVQAMSEGGLLMSPISQRVSHLGEIARAQGC